MCPNQLPDIPDISNPSCPKNCYKERASTKSDTVLAGGSPSRFPKLGFRYAVKTWGFKQTSTYTHSYKAVSVSCAVASEQVVGFISHSSPAGSFQGISGFDLSTTCYGSQPQCFSSRGRTGFVIWGGVDVQRFCFSVRKEEEKGFFAKPVSKGLTGQHSFYSGQTQGYSDQTTSPP